MYEQNELNPFLRTSAAISALREKRYQESNNTFDAFSKAALMGTKAYGQSQGTIPLTGQTGGGAPQGGTPQTGGGSGMGGNWQNQIGGSYGGGYYDPYLQTWIPG
jgi:hypothetical protein